MCFFCNYSATTEIYTYLHTLSLHDALPISLDAVPAQELGRTEALLLVQFVGDDGSGGLKRVTGGRFQIHAERGATDNALLPSHAGANERSEEHTSELQSLMRIPYAVFSLKKKRPQRRYPTHPNTYDM